MCCPPPPSLQSEVLVALGNVVMAADPEEGLQCLQIAVKLREDEVGMPGAQGALGPGVRRGLVRGQSGGGR